jgi:hypothetical protein
MLTEGAARELIAESISVLTRNMERVSPRLWRRPLTDEHWATLSISAWKGAGNTLTYGVSCAWVPHLVGRQWRWHRTAKQARADINIDHWAADAPDFVNISWLDPPGVIRRRSRRAANKLAPDATAWWSTVATIEGVSAEADHQAAIAGHFLPHTKVTAAFTHARLGRRDRGAQILRSIDWLATDSELLAGAMAKLTGVAELR